MIILHFKQGPQKGTRIELDQDRIAFGRNPESDVIIEDPRSSWDHFAIERTGPDGYIVVDQGSRNGTYLGEDLTPVTVPEPLHQGASLWFGDTELEVRFSTRRTFPDLPPLQSDRTAEIDPAAALAMYEAARHRQETEEVTVHRRGSSLANPSEIWEGVRDESVVVDEFLDDEDLATFPDSFRLRARLVFLAGPHEGRVVYLGSRDTLIGRDEATDVPMDDDLCSRMHAKLGRTSQGEYTLEDLGSRNGSMLNGKRISTRRILSHRALITLGKSVIEYRAALIDEREENPLKTVAMSLPLYTFEGKVLTQYEMGVGRDPTTDLVLEDRSVDRKHATLQWRGSSFYLRDISDRGTYINGKRIVEAELKDGDIVKIGIYQLTMSIEGLRCSIDTLQTRPDEQESFVAGAAKNKPYRTLIRLEIPDELKAASSSAQKVSPLKFKRKKVTWEAPLETVPSWRLPLVVTTALASVFFLVAVFSFARGSAFLNAPLSPTHDSQTFALVADAKDVSSSCVACHSPLQETVDAKCNACHTRELSTMHASAAQEGKENFSCNACHTEHEDPAFIATNLLRQCSSCHEDRHAKLNKVSPGPVTLKAPAIERDGKTLTVSIQAGKSVDELHKIHEEIERRCAGCHSNKAQTAKIDAYTSCMRCHGSTDTLADNPCYDCHGNEHGPQGDWITEAIGRPTTPQERQARIFSEVSFLGSLGTGVFAAIMLFFPVGLVILVHSLFSRRVLPLKEEEEGSAEGAQGEEKDNDWHEVWELDIDAEKCVGAGPCVHACPYNVLVFDNDLHQAVAKYVGACHGCRACSKACPQNAIIVYKASQGMPSKNFPDLDPNYEVNDLPGLFLIGQVTEFKALMKNAANLGARTVQYIAHNGIAPGSAKAKGFDYEVFVAGAGPGGIAAGIEAANQGMRYVVCEKSSDIAYAHTELMHIGKPVQANPRNVQSISALQMFEGFRSREEVLEDWHNAIESNGLQINFQEQVQNVEPQGEGFVITTNRGAYRALRVILAIGSNGNPRKPGCPGEDMDKVHFSLKDPTAFDNKDIMVIGAGNSALEIAIALANANGGSNRVKLSYRKGMDGSRASAENKAKVAALADEGRIELHMHTTPNAIKNGEIVLNKKDKSTYALPNDVVFCALGRLSPKKWLEKIGVKYVKKPANWNPGRTDDLGFLSQPPEA